uniref:Eukaryotic translation initiation factor 3, subunit H, b n=1 Tax=Astyanax mexicanus TaxID=7994 RepID=A0A8B9LR10_ASTMX
VHYQMEMMRSLRHVNIDHLHVGWYQSTFYGSFVSRALLDSQFSYQHAIEESVVLVYVPSLTYLFQFLHQCKCSLKKLNIIENNNEFSERKYCINHVTVLCFYTFLHSSYLEKSLQMLMDRVDDMSQDIVKYNNYSRSLSKQQQQKHQYLRLTFLCPSVSPFFSDVFFFSFSLGQINTYCQTVKEFTAQNLGKLFMAEVLQGHGS